MGKVTNILEVRLSKENWENPYVKCFIPHPTPGNLKFYDATKRTIKFWGTNGSQLFLPLVKTKLFPYFSGAVELCRISTLMIWHSFKTSSSELF